MKRSRHGVGFTYFVLWVSQYLESKYSYSPTLFVYPKIIMSVGALRRKNRKNMKTIIQFPHPGGEHNNKTGTKWNTGSHKRKYLKVKGSYLKTLSSKPIKDTVYFWGEWEAQSHVTPISGVIKHNFPKYIFEPCYKLPVGTANTDPFVFGNQFYYCICKQGHYPALRNLDKGDMILFGSNLNKHFVLDTVFVIKDWQEFEIKDLASLKSKFNDAFYHASLEPIINAKQVTSKCIAVDTKTGLCLPENGDNNDDDKTVLNGKYRIYEAVMYSDKDSFNGIFSYSPCLPDPVGRNGFARPIINHSSVSQGLNQGIKIIKNEDVVKVWNEITTSILNQDNNLNLMINTELPSICTNLKNQ